MAIRGAKGATQIRRGPAMPNHILGSGRSQAVIAAATQACPIHHNVGARGLTGHTASESGLRIERV